MFFETIDLYEYFKLPRAGATGGYLRSYAATLTNEVSKRYFPAMLVIPGGAYFMVSEREGEPVALRFAAEGYQAFVLEYTVQTAFPVPLIEAAMAMAYLRENAEKYCILKDKVCAVGFSAGGHLTGMLATLYDDDCIKAALKERADHVRPDAVILSYAVITSQEATHADTMRTISGGDEALKQKLSVETRVKKGGVPAFIWHTADDPAVPSENSFLFAAACQKAGVPYELHVFETGPHGLSVLTAQTMFSLSENYLCKEWFPLAVKWLTRRGFTAKEA